MKKTELLIQRLEAIGQSLAQSGNGLALLGLGSVGLDTARLDRYSDLDFFAIVEPGWKNRFIDHLDWLERLCPIAYCFRNTYDGYKLMFADGVFCEFAVFEPHELQHIPFPPGRIVWQRGDFNADCCHPVHAAAAQPSTDIAWLVGEAVTNIYVGLGRYHRGERLSAMTFIQNYAFQRVLDLNAASQPGIHEGKDPFARERRFESCYPQMKDHLARMLAGYSSIVESAAAIMDYLQQRFDVNPKMREEIDKLIALGREHDFFAPINRAAMVAA